MYIYCIYPRWTPPGPQSTKQPNLAMWPDLDPTESRLASHFSNFRGFYPSCHYNLILPLVNLWPFSNHKTSTTMTTLQSATDPCLALPPASPETMFWWLNFHAAAIIRGFFWHRQVSSGWGVLTVTIPTWQAIDQALPLQPSSPGLSSTIPTFAAALRHFPAIFWPALGWSLSATSLDMLPVTWAVNHHQRRPLPLCQCQLVLLFDNRHQWPCRARLLATVSILFGPCPSACATVHQVDPAQSSNLTQSEPTRSNSAASHHLTC